MAVTGCILAPFVLAGCGSSGDEPAGLDATDDTSTAAETPGSDDANNPDESPTSDTSPDAEDDGDGDASSGTPAPTFTQPYLEEENVVELRDIAPVEPHDDATDEEAEVLETLGRYTAAFEQIMWGVSFEDSGIEEYVIDPNLTTVREHAAELEEREMVSVGPPVEEVALSVNIDGDTASAETCLNTRGWIDVPGDGSAPSSADPLRVVQSELERVDGEWKVSRVVHDYDVSPCEGIFE
ncbi:hypothetical protein EF847_22360 [Actinobacteria bacterium YIM 96077]|uniref:Uncharacterized protein n=2 Tax=Phytoactinopolyspora halophila TaxID=1981511 RepID=A0A329QU13_9ACTN|nr:hypothetical protein EF847_22360 [Actinobacteria bacterium YIM 96077]RAW14208.1 hypothetical protein DPM12_11160 [Phytoactinopolyspora halophila]